LDDRGALIPPAEFISTKLTAKASRQLQGTGRSEFAIGRACWLNKEIGNYSKKKEREGYP
jgi:hypothetical protein